MYFWVFICWNHLKKWILRHGQRKVDPRGDGETTWAQLECQNKQWGKKEGLRSAIGHNYGLHKNKKNKSTMCDPKKDECGKWKCRIFKRRKRGSSLPRKYLTPCNWRIVGELIKLNRAGWNIRDSFYAFIDFHKFLSNTL